MTLCDPAVLLVDDDIDIREALTDVLEDRGFAVLTAENGLVPKPIDVERPVRTLRRLRVASGAS